jgi:serine/threonine protein phosphatase PrpC
VARLHSRHLPVRSLCADRLHRAEDAATSSLFFCVLDGHGEAGELVSGFFQRELARQLFAHASFAEDPKSAFCEVLKTTEQALIHGTESSGLHSRGIGSNTSDVPQIPRSTPSSAARRWSLR